MSQRLETQNQELEDLEAKKQEMQDKIEVFLKDLRRQGISLGPNDEDKINDSASRIAAAARGKQARTSVETLKSARGPSSGAAFPLIGGNPAVEEKAEFTEPASEPIIMLGPPEPEIGDEPIIMLGPPDAHPETMAPPRDISPGPIAMAGKVDMLEAAHAKSMQNQHVQDAMRNSPTKPPIPLGPGPPIPGGPKPPPPMGAGPPIPGSPGFVGAGSPISPSTPMSPQDSLGDISQSDMNQPPLSPRPGGREYLFA